MKFWGAGERKEEKGLVTISKEEIDKHLEGATSTEPGPVTEGYESGLLRSPRGNVFSRSTQKREPVSSPRSVTRAPLKRTRRELVVTNVQRRNESRTALELKEYALQKDPQSDSSTLGPSLAGAMKNLGFDTTSEDFDSNSEHFNGYITKCFNFKRVINESYDNLGFPS